jgi:hypothetical protein
MIEWLKDIFSPIHAQDPDFGRMRYLRDSNTWEGHMQFSPIGGLVEILLSGGPSGPSQQQRTFLRAVETRYSELWPIVKAHLLEAAAPIPEVSATAQAFTLVAVDLPAEVDGNVSWELCYETEPKSWFFAVEMRGWAPMNVSAEC